uniref:Uncharacterized protein n=1 Tax=Physcomitrium patens TaxID=3218 RepID=A0A2K1KFA3_PHYPA|nr:hypothetical protein PHYPA_008831 [Physcomitrium patens]
MPSDYSKNQFLTMLSKVSKNFLALK